METMVVSGYGKSCVVESVREYKFRIFDAIEDALAVRDYKTAAKLVDEYQEQQW